MKRALNKYDCSDCAHSEVCKYRDNVVKVHDAMEEMKGGCITLEINIICAEYIEEEE